MIRGSKTVGALALAGLALWLTKQPAPREDDVEHAAPEPPRPVPPTVAPARRSWRRRAAITLAYTTLFFAGAAVVAGAGNQLAQVDNESTDAALVSTDATDAVTDTTTTETSTDATTTTDAATTTEDAPAVAAPAPDPSDATQPVAATADPVTRPAQPARPAAAPAPAPASRHKAAHRAASPVSSPFPVLAFDPRAWLVAHRGTPTGDAAVALAEQFLGVPYRWGGNAPSTGFDCSGLTQYVYAQLGIWLPHYAAAQFLAYAHVDPTQLEPGDLVFFEPKPDGPGHVAVYAGGDVIVEAPHTGAVVRLGSLSSAAASLGFLGAVRPSEGVSTVPALLQPFAFVAPAAASTPGNWLAQPV